LHLTPKHLSACIKQVTGRTALQMIFDFKLNNAKALLTQTSLTVSEIAYESGFENPHYFSSFFKRHIGLTPLEFRKI
ncbi:MAG: AraC family transcriptional regulator, partial [Leptolyngbya sp. SIO1D8]|nr:AraC family transcriptional regulator [Leptolyngbya sp. SIO1D8]